MDLSLFQNATRGAFAAALIAYVCALGTATANGMGAADFGSVTGRVVDRRSLQGIPNARIRIGSLVGLTDATGAFRIDTVPAGTRTVFISAVGWKGVTLTVVVQKDQTTVIPDVIALVAVLGP